MAGFLAGYHSGCWVKSWRRVTMVKHHLGGPYGPSEESVAWPAVG